MKIDREQFDNLAKQGFNRIPVVHEILADLDNPLSIYLKLANQPFTYLFESILGGEKWGRYSFIGLACQKIIRVKNQQLTLYDGEKLIEKIETTDPLHWIEEYQKQFKAPELTNFPRFNGGLVGYFGYDTVRYIETKLSHCKLSDPLDNPDILLMQSEEFIVFDTLYNKVFCIIYVDPASPDAWDNAQNHLATRIQQIYNTKIPDSWLQVGAVNEVSSKFCANMTKAQYMQAVERAVEYMIAGDAMQIVLAQRLSKSYLGEPFNFYRALRNINPSPYLYYLNLGDFQIVGSSPEILVRVDERQITLRPLAGTRPRGKNLPEDLLLAKELLEDPKELAEHLMLIDLGRNDVGRVSMTGSVKVTEKMSIERYSHVMHIVSNVTGELDPAFTPLNVLRAAFPAGTLTGTPKIRAMEIIDELETVKRGVYSGAVGYLAWNGNMDLAIAIRTAIIKNKEIHVQAGAGLVVDSIPEQEWQECMNKAMALLRAAEMAERGLK